MKTTSILITGAGTELEKILLCCWCLGYRVWRERTHCARRRFEVEAKKAGVEMEIFTGHYERGWCARRHEADILINNAGVGSRGHSWKCLLNALKISWRRMYRVRCAHAGMRAHMLKRKAGESSR
jgi:hypothetical protein